MANQLIGADSVTGELPEPVRTRLAAEVSNDSTEIGAAVKAVAEANGGSGEGLDATGVVVGRVPTAQGDDTWEWADQTGGGSGGVTDHGALTGLEDDDHPQYHNDARGDARYFTQAQVNTALAGKAETTHNHTLSEITDAGTAAGADSGDFASAAQGALADTAVQPGALSPVATSGDYSDLTGTPSIPEGIPAGGSVGQVLTKASGTDYDAGWTDPSGGGGTLTDSQIAGYILDEQSDSHSAVITVAGSGGGAALTRSTVAYTTASLADGAAEDGELDATLDVAQVLTITADVDCRVTVYSSQARADADAARGITTAPQGNHGMLVDVLVEGGAVLPMSPVPTIYAETSESVWVRVRNDSGASAAVGVTMTVVRLVG